MFSYTDEVFEFEKIEIEDVTEIQSKPEFDLDGTPPPTPIEASTPAPEKKSRQEIKFTSGWRKVVRLMDVIQAQLISEKRVKELEEGTVR